MLTDNHELIIKKLIEMGFEYGSINLNKLNVSLDSLLNEVNDLEEFGLIKIINESEYYYSEVVYFKYNDECVFKLSDLFKDENDAFNKLTSQGIF